MDKPSLPNRRAAIKGSAAAVACALPLTAAAAPPAAVFPLLGDNPGISGIITPDLDARLHQLMADWRIAYAAAQQAAEAGAPDAELDMGPLWAIERDAAGIRPATLQGFAIKLVMLTNYGEHDLDGPASGMVAEAEAIAGYAPPAGFVRG